MPIRVRLDRMLVRRCMSLGELCDRVGLAEADLQLLRAGRAAAVRMSTLDVLCRELGCGPGDLLEYQRVDPAIDLDVDEA